MEKEKHRWGQFLCATVYGVLMLLELKTYLELVVVQDKIFNLETWQVVQIEYVTKFCVYIGLIMAFSLPFFLFRRKKAALWIEAVAMTILLLLGVIGVILSKVIGAGRAIISICVLIFLNIRSWSNVWKNYRKARGVVKSG